MVEVTARSLGLSVCHSCGLASRAPDDHDLVVECPRCDAPLHRRKPASLTRTWALLLSAMLLYIPANVLPVMHSKTLFMEEDDTILSGVVVLWHSGSWPLAILVFFASIMVPMLKVLGLSLLAWTAQRRSRWDPLQRARLYRVIEFVGRWSMLDIYVVTLLVSLVQLRSLATIQAGAGAVAFGSVVVLTMLASMSFDPRLIWDPFDQDDNRAGDASRSKDHQDHA
jgi:paraquat-inducible protein A